MRHLKSGRKLGRTAAHRRATMSALSAALINNEKITTTLAKAKELRRFVEPLITRAKNDTNFNRARVFRFLRDKEAITKLFDEIGPMVEDRPGGYTRVIKTGFRSGDGAEMALIELVDYNDVPPETGAKKKKTRRGGRRRGSGKAKGSQAAPKATESESTQAKASKADSTQSQETKQTKEKASAKGSTSTKSESTADQKQTETSKAKTADKKEEKPASDKKASTKASEAKDSPKEDDQSAKDESDKKEE